MFKLFTKLREISIKLPPTRVKKARVDRQSVPGSSELEHRAPESVAADLAEFAAAESPEISGNLFQNNAHESILVTNTAGESATPPDTIPAPKKSGKLASKKAKHPILTAASRTGAVVGKTAGKVGATIAKPFKGEKPFHKTKKFWIGSSLGLGLLTLVGSWIFVDQSVNQYAPTDALSYVRPGTITIKGVNGQILLQTGNATRETLKAWQMPDKLKKAFVAIEDRRFYEHDGVDYKGVTRALLQNITSRNLVEGASSINQQLARMVYLNQERSFWAKSGLTKGEYLLGAGGIAARVAISARLS